MGYLWTKYLKLRFLGLVPLFPDLTRWLGTAALNECLHRGPVILEDLCGLLKRFRTHKVALTADIERAFLQVGSNLQIETSLGSCGSKIPLSH